MSGDQRLKAIVVDILLLDDDEYRDATGPDDVETWDSLGTVRIVEAVSHTFGYRMDIEEMVSVQSIGDIKSILRRRGVFGMESPARSAAEGRQEP
ncbi:acyl carrier protein [Pseudonocardia nigra]|uniref:acyl carrier protein n=1 Tax=Pseudonocardia nigra TaxID=1921578 RepID=UPI001C5D44E3|nr:acyl carrier protein [Pseudonocardia nigra]